MNLSDKIRSFFNKQTDYLGNFNFAHLTIAGDIPEEKTPSPIPFVKTEKQHTFWEIERFLLQIEHSALAGVLISLRSTGMGFARANALRKSLQRLRNVGKKVYVHLVDPGNIEYFIASSADHISISPLSTLNLTGLSTEVFFFRDLLDSLQIEPEIIGIGEYKSAAETFSRSKMSEYNREMLNSILDHQFENILDSITKSRQIQSDKIAKYLDDAPFTPDKSVKYGFIDAIDYEEGIKQLIEEDLGLDLRIITMDKLEKLISYSMKLNGILSRLRGDASSVALVTINGIITQGTSRSGTGGMRTAGSETVTRTLNKVKKDSTVKAVVIRIFSPGGSAVASDQIRNSIAKLSEDKPVYISMSDVAASGGYMASLSGTKIYCDTFSLTGSIGVVAGKINIGKVLERIGINSEILTRGKMSAIYSVTKGFSPEERQNFTDVINNMYSMFVEMVSSSRNMDKEECEKAARGRVWTGGQAKEIGLVDYEGGLVNAIGAACSDLGITGEFHKKVKVFTHESRISLNNIGRIFGIYETGIEMNFPGGEFIYTIMPFWLRIK